MPEDIPVQGLRRMGPLRSSARLVSDMRLHAKEREMTAPYYEDAGVRLFHADCRELLPELELVDHVITDPPYATETHEGARGGAGDTTLVTFDATTADELRALYGRLKARRWLLATMDWRHVHALELEPPQGWRFVRFGVWVKPNGAPQFTGDRPATGWEAVACLHRDVPGKMRWNNGGHHAVFTHSKINGAHPTAKPESLLSELISAFTDAGDLILDPFAGSGTTGVAAKRLGRRCILIEREEKYCASAAQRLSQGALDLFAKGASRVGT